MLAKVDLSIKKKSSKCGIIWFNNANNIEIVFILLTEVVVFYIQVFVIEIWKL